MASAETGAMPMVMKTTNKFLVFLFLLFLETPFVLASETQTEAQTETQTRGPYQGFAHKDGLAVLVDFKSVQSHLSVDLENQNQNQNQNQNRVITTQSAIRFQQNQPGYPLINLPFNAEISSLKIDGKTYEDIQQFQVTLMNPKIQWGLRALPLSLSPGEHEIHVTYSLVGEIQHVLSYPGQGTIDLMSFMDDYLKQGPNKNQGFIDLLFPANLQFDAYKFDLKIEIVGLAETHLVKANGSVSEQKKSKNGILETSISFPDSFTSNSFFLHVFRESLLTDERSRKASHYTSLDGRKILVETYCPELPKFCDFTHKTALESLELTEKTLGLYPFDRLTLRKIPSRNHTEMHGMEYSGAGVVNDSNVLHEVVHSWYGRSVRPFSGRDGWIDEAVAAWADDYGGGNFARAEKVDFEGDCRGYKNLLGKMDPTRLHSASYGQGREFLARLDKHFASQGGIAPTLQAFFERYKHKPVKTEQFLGFLAKHPLWDEKAELVKRVLVLGTNEHFDEDACWPAKLPPLEEE